MKKLLSDMNASRLPALLHTHTHAHRHMCMYVHAHTFSCNCYQGTSLEYVCRGYLSPSVTAEVSSDIIPYNIYIVLPVLFFTF